ncbi:UDP-3-O-(3-hydroxymyristoyl)glucosamine N-acyltransferase [Zhouia sp. PK063]|uniref:UDP-3-O-(3-hydroxymyristoyl)glucosamine N-acyltransferase n=1 Tax=Zhouia sp. PK063 TaxID=3373602 RepID=UPI0037958522
MSSRLKPNILYTIPEICELIEGTSNKSSSLEIKGIESLQNATPEQISFVSQPKHLKDVEQSKAAAFVVSKSLPVATFEDKLFITVDQVEIAVIQLLDAFHPGVPEPEEAIHSTAVVHPTAKIGNDVKIDAGVFIGKNVIIEDGCTIYPNVTILEGASVGKHTTIWSGTVIREFCVVGSYGIIHANVSIGNDGFGFCQNPKTGQLVKVPHIGNVIIGDHVEIGANSCIDRGKFSATTIGNHCKLDNLVQIAHNCVLEDYCIIAGQSGLAGSVKLGMGVTVGGSVCVKDHTTVHAGASIGGGSGVVKDVPAGTTVLGYPAMEAKQALRLWGAFKKMVS